MQKLVVAHTGLRFFIYLKFTKQILASIKYVVVTV